MRTESLKTEEPKRNSHAMPLPAITLDAYMTVYFRKPDIKTEIFSSLLD